MDRVFSLTLLSTLYSIPQIQQQVFTISFWLSPSPVWACSIYLFRQHIISFWRSHFTPVTAILVAAIRNESNLSSAEPTKLLGNGVQGRTLLPGQPRPGDD